MDCPKCKTVELAPSKLDGGLPAMGCEKCQGVSISLLYYRDWVERFPDDTNTEKPESTKVSELHDSDTHAALVCPKCAKLMSKFMISGKTKNRIDVCTSCDEAWLDGGEWQLLKSLRLAKSIPSILTDSWQHRVRQEVLDEKKLSRLKTQIGVESAEKVEEFREWLEEHEKRPEILFYLNQK